MLAGGCWSTRRAARIELAPHGHVAAVLGVLRALDLERLLARER